MYTACGMISSCHHSSPRRNPKWQILTHDAKSSEKVKMTYMFPSTIPQLHFSIRHVLPSEGLRHMGLENIKNELDARIRI
jgi:hypothetical protein